MGCSSTSVLIVNAEVDSMGGVVDGEVGIANKSSPQKVAIEKVQAELRQECGVRDDCKRELDFLEKGGNPLEFKLGIPSSVSVHSTSITNQHPDQFVNSQAKGSHAITASPHGDSFESSDRPGTTRDPNIADNLLLFDAENEFSEGGRSLLRSSVLQSEQSFLMDRTHKTLEHGVSASFSIPRKAYKRRYRSRPNGDGVRLSSTDVNPSQGCHGTSLHSQHVPKDVEVLLSDADNQKIISNQNLKSTNPSHDIPKTVVADGQNIVLHGLKIFQSTKDAVQDISVDAASDVIAHENSLRNQSTPDKIYSNGSEAIQTEEMTSSAIKFQPTVTTAEADNQSDSCQMNGFSRKIGDGLMSDNRDNIVSHAAKLLNSESSCVDASQNVTGNNDSDMCTGVKFFESNRNLKNQNLGDGTSILENDKFLKEMKDPEGIKYSDFVNKECTSTCQSKLDKDSLILPKTELDKVESALKEKLKYQDINEGTGTPGPTQVESGAKPTAPLIDCSAQTKYTSSEIRPQETFDVVKSDLPQVGFSDRTLIVSFEAQTSPGSDSKLACKIDEDSILKEAQIIEAKRKRITELSVVTSSVEIYQKYHWDYVLEEMAWLANDFAQEHIWKLAAASQISYQVAAASRWREREKSFGLDAKRVAHTLAKVVMEFWHSIELQAHETNLELEQHCQKNGALSVLAYAARILKCDKSNMSNNQAEVLLIPDKISDSEMLDLSWKDSLTEENLFYAVPAVESYKKAIESHMALYESMGSSVQEESETSGFDVVAEGETNIYGMPMTFEASRSSRYGQKKRKHHGARQYVMGSDMLPMHSVENKLVTPRFGLLAKPSASNINVSIPTKRMRTASRRVVSPFGACASGCIQVPNKKDASSCDTNSFQDDQSILRGGLVVPNSLEVESAGEFEYQSPFDSAEVLTKPKRRRKANHLLNTTYEQRWQVDSSFQNEQGHFQKRIEINQFESNGNNGLLGQPMAKKPKIMQQPQDNSFDNIPPSAMSVPSPVGSQTSNMSNSNKFIKMLAGRDRGRKHKYIKMPSGQSGSGSTWSLFEDQALVVLAHDLGPNWELISDAFNSALNIKYIFRKAKECEERHICLMDRSSGDGADSADDSWSSQPHPSTLPGIPKGSARQLFQRLQGPMEEETLKSHFEKIIMIGHKQHYRRTQNDNQDPKQFQQSHSSHAIALSQVCPNNANGGPVLTPLDLCDASGPDVISHGYQVAHSSGLSILNQGSLPQMHPASGSTAALQGPSNMMMGNNFSPSPAPVNTSARDTRYGFPRSGTLPADEHQRMHLYNQMIAGRNMPQSSISSPGAVPGTECGGRILSSGSGMGMMSVANRNIPIPRSGLQGIPSSSIVNSGSVVSPGMPSGNVLTVLGTGQGCSMVRPPEAINMLRPGLTPDPLRKMMASDLPTPCNSQGVSHSGGLNSSLSNQTSPPVSSYPLHQPSPISPQQPQVLSPHQSHFQGSANHASNTQQPAYAFRMAKERQLQHRLLQQQPQQFVASNSLTSQQPQLPISSSPLQNSPHVQPLTSSPPASLSPSMPAPAGNAMPQQQPKHQMPTQGVARNAQSASSGLNNQTVKPRPRQQHPKIVKGIGRGNSMMHQNNPTDISITNGVSTNPGKQCLGKGEPAVNSTKSQGLYTDSAQNSMPQSRMYSIQGASSSKHLKPTPELDNSGQGRGPLVTSPVLSALHQPGSNNQAPPHQKLVDKNQPSLQGLAQPNRQNSSDPSLLPKARDSDSDHHLTGRMDARTTLPQVSISASNAVLVVSQPSGHKWHASEPLVDTNALNTPKSLVSIPSNSREYVVQARLDQGQRPPTILGHGNKAQWQQQQQQSQQPHSPVPQPQQHQQPLLHSQPQAQLLQEGSGNLHGRSSDAGLE